MWKDARVRSGSWPRENATASRRRRTVLPGIAIRLQAIARIGARMQSQGTRFPSVGLLSGFSRSLGQQRRLTDVQSWSAGPPTSRRSGALPRTGVTLTEVGARSPGPPETPESGNVLATGASGSCGSASPSRIVLASAWFGLAWMTIDADRRHRNRQG